MEHLSRDALLAWIEGSRDPDALAHLAECPQCRGEAEALDVVCRDIARVPMPEPSPLFWEHFSRRVRERIDAGESGAPSWRERVRSWRWQRAMATIAPVAAVAVVIAVAGPALYRSATVSPTPAVGEMPALTSDMGAEPWETVVELAEAYAEEADEVPGGDGSASDTPLAPGSAERAAAELSAAESQELARLLQFELDRR